MPIETANPRRPRRGALVPAIALLALILAPATGSGRIVVPHDDAGAAVVLDRIERAVLASDHRSLADLMSASGVRVCIGPDPDRSTDLLPSQAFYYFKTVFQERQTSGFQFEKRQEVAGDRVHAVAIWRFLTADSGRESCQRVLFVLAREHDGWRVTEITAWR